ncbi:hypothetical protein [Bifidobacterium sp. ESL0745]|uniref:hypothetical protein n=1 Tax=Bifidobacterium sp. ESL0745 TaxID=2983226 RepID=UPI0023F82BBC|nr:hypothetical protein [Bifidobacterium sp. ESL0745]MDF7665131.1 hypothetical protein [Bifidobacterium sp. ESL0745]
MSADSMDRNNHSDSTVSEKPSRLKTTLISVTVAVLTTTTLLSACGGTQGSSSSSTSSGQSSSESAPKNESNNNQDKENNGEKGLSTSQVAKDLGYKTVGEAGIQDRKDFDDYISKHVVDMGYIGCTVDSNYEVSHDGIMTDCSFNGKKHSGNVSITTNAKSNQFNLYYYTFANDSKEYETKSNYIPTADEAEKIIIEKILN